MRLVVAAWINPILELLLRPRPNLYATRVRQLSFSHCYVPGLDAATINDDVAKLWGHLQGTTVGYGYRPTGPGMTEAGSR